LVFAVFETGARAEPFSGTARRRFVLVLPLFILLPALGGPEALEDRSPRPDRVW
jgi:hypothetical protein